MMQVVERISSAQQHFYCVLPSVTFLLNKIKITHEQASRNHLASLVPLFPLLPSHFQTSSSPSVCPSHLENTDLQSVLLL